MEILQWKNVVEPGEKFHIARANRTPRHSVPPHGHDFAEVFWIDAGVAIHTVNGQSFPMNVGDLVFIRPGDIHAMEPQDEAFQLTNLAFACDALDDFGARYFTSRDFAWWTNNRLPATEKLETEQLARLNRWADEMIHAPRDFFWLHRFLLNLLHQLRPQVETAVPDSEGAPLWLQYACREMQKPENLVKGLDTFFTLGGRSREHTARLLRQSCGMSPTEFLQDLRLQRAARQLETSNKEILAIAFDCGFENISHFYRLFKRRFGQTPKAYRKRRQLF